MFFRQSSWRATPRCAVSSLYFSLSASISGFSRRMAMLFFTCERLSGKSTSRAEIVRRKIAQPQLPTMPCSQWRYETRARAIGTNVPRFSTSDAPWSTAARSPRSFGPM